MNPPIIVSLSSRPQLVLFREGNDWPPRCSTSFSRDPNVFSDRAQVYTQGSFQDRLARFGSPLKVTSSCSVECQSQGNHNAVTESDVRRKEGRRDLAHKIPRSSPSASNGPHPEQRVRLRLMPALVYVGKRVPSLVGYFVPSRQKCSLPHPAR